MVRIIAMLALCAGALTFVPSPAEAQGKVVRGVPCNQQASHALCVACVQKRGGGGATGGAQFCSNTLRPQATPVRQKQRS